MSKFFIIKVTSTLDSNELDYEIKENIDILEKTHCIKIKSIESKYIDDDFAMGLMSIILRT